MNRTNGGKDKIKAELVICGNVVKHAVSFREEDMACSVRESVKAQIWSESISKGHIYIYTQGSARILYATEKCDLLYI